jgi:uridine phosphorylase
MRPIGWLATYELSSAAIEQEGQSMHAVPRRPPAVAAAEMHAVLPAIAREDGHMPLL